MIIKQSKDYENASRVLLNHKDMKYFENCSIILSCVKSRKISNNTISNWGELKFRFEFINHDMQYKTIGGYKSLLFSKSEFIDLVMSIQEALNNPNCYVEDTTIKRRINNDDLFIRFSVSKKYNINAVLMGVYNNKSGYIYIGLDSLLFNQYMMQIGRMIVDMINFEINFDQNIFLYRNNQFLEYHINQQNQLITMLSAQYNNLPNNNIIENEETKVEENIGNNHCECDGFDFLENNVQEKNEKPEKIINKNEEENKINIEKNQNEFLENLDEKIEETELVEIFPQRKDEIENPPEIKEIDENTSNIIKAIEKTKIDVTIFSQIFEDFTKNNYFLEGCFNKFYQKIYETDKQEYKYPHCNENDYKSIFYLAHKQYYSFLDVIINKQISLEDSGVEKINLKYEFEKKLEISEIKDIYDLVAIYVYLQAVHKKLKNRSNNSIENKEMFCEFFRLVFEPYYLSFLTELENVNGTFEKSILNHYHQLKNLDFFKPFEELIDEFKLHSINEKDIRYFILQLKDVIIDNRKSLKNIHEYLNKLKYIKLPYKNKFNKEHINSICLYEVSLGNKRKTKEEILKFIEMNKINDTEIVDFIKEYYLIENDNQSKMVDISDDLDNVLKKAKTSNSTLYRYVNKYLDNNESYKKELLEKIKAIGENNLNFKDFTDFNLHQIPENILIAMHNWRHIEDNTHLKKYSTFIKNVESSIETKNDILAVYTAEKENVLNNSQEKNISAWDNLF